MKLRQAKLHEILFKIPAVAQGGCGMLETASGDENCNQIVRRYGGPVWVKNGLMSMSALSPHYPELRTLVGVVGRSLVCHERTSGRGLDGMISACATSGGYASFQPQRALYSPSRCAENSS